MLIDTHAHVNFNAYKNDGQEVIKRALAGNTWLINAGSQFSTSARAVEIAQNYQTGVWAAVGIHPIHLGSERFQTQVDKNEAVKFETRAEKFETEKYQKLIENKKAVAVGECGLDYYHNEKNKKQQKELFIQQIDLAIKNNLPVIVHCRNAHNDVLEILRKKNRKYGKKLRGVIHSFSGRLAQARQYVEELGFCLGFNGIITFARDYDKVLAEIGLENLLMETDCPYLTPEPFRGKRNEPLYVRYVAEKLAEIKNISLVEVEKTTTQNARELFGI
ncbi:MAG: hydrolase TatD [Candidatus Portnoybacteria bacterium CG10_big_fil_rev_8_21_14_0_10_44_7]|uniref:Hydrolase TatD n=1 Tax=Candidatus Portnoybacteria bacterium CG10_big_fil_rev_8_21_14_0_10_44_7 TaxID=1974816 RepID=A0A2M8KJ52_9BACT|nr:MAG: hydrolase TatD [Candidatus Portnoybacteria bacterium CG10_big_fil_rev_8_21_14_0_10_44_7]